MARFLLCLWVVLAPAWGFTDDARAAAQALWNGDRGGLQRKQLERICRFLEKTDSKGGGRQVFSKKRTHLPYTIERSMAPDGYVLVRLLGPRAKIGEGIHKVVRKAFLYGPDPKVVAECITDESAAKEIRMLEQLQGCRGIVQYFGSAPHHNRTCSIFLKYYPTGSLEDAIAKGCRFSARQRTAIAADALAGLYAMHERRLVHRDLHPGNILIDKSPSGRCSAALIDFEKTAHPEEVSDADPPQEPRRRNPPEALVQKFSTIDRYAADIYAMGCNLYFLEWGMNVPWAKWYNVYQLNSLSLEQRARMHRRITRQYAKLKKEKIGAILSRNRCPTPIERLRILIFEMLSVSPAERPNASEALTFLERCSTAASMDLNSSLPTRSVQEKLS